MAVTVTATTENNLTFVNIECILSKQYYLGKRSTFKSRSQTL